MVSAWAMFEYTDVGTRSDAADARGPNLLAHIVHQSVNEDLWFSVMPGISVTVAPVSSPSPVARHIAGVALPACRTATGVPAANRARMIPV